MLGVCQKIKHTHRSLLLHSSEAEGRWEDGKTINSECSQYMVYETVVSGKGEKEQGKADREYGGTGGKTGV